MTAKRTVVERPAATTILRSGSPSTRHLPGRFFRRTTWLPAGVLSAVNTPTSPLMEPSTPAGSIDTLNLNASTPGPRLVTPTVTRPDAGCDFTVLAHAGTPRSNAAEAHTAMPRVDCMSEHLLLPRNLWGTACGVTCGGRACSAPLIF